MPNQERTRKALGVPEFDMSVSDWGASFSAPPDLCSSSTDWRGGLIRRWIRTGATMEQPPLDQHYVALHLGGPKRVTRRSGNRTLVADAKPVAVTLVPAGTAYSWSTEGPIGFAHLYIAPKAADRVVQEEFDRDPRQIELEPAVARESPLLSSLLAGMLAEVEAPGFASRLMLDTMLHSFTVYLLRDHSTLPRISFLAPHRLAPSRLRRVLDYVESNYDRDIGLDDLAAVAGSSRYHFSRAFAEATGMPPYRYLVHRRVHCAKALLLGTSLSLPEIAARCGFNSAAQLSAMFKRAFGSTPSHYRREH